MNFKVLFCFISVFFVCYGITLSALAQTLCFGTSVTYIGDHDEQTYYNHDEITWNLNASVAIHKRFHAGVQALNIFSDGGNTGFKYYHILGVFAQGDILKMNRSRVFAEASLNQGNYLLSNRFRYPKEGKNLIYTGLGGGLELPLNVGRNRLYLDLSFVSYLTLSDVQDTYAYTQYIIGLNYKFGKTDQN